MCEYVVCRAYRHLRNRCPYPCRGIWRWHIHGNACAPHMSKLQRVQLV